MTHFLSGDFFSFHTHHFLMLLGDEAGLGLNLLNTSVCFS